MTAGQRARLALLELLSRLVLGRSGSGGDRGLAAAQLGVHGFRGALRSRLLRAWLGGGGGDPVVLAPVLGGSVRLAVSAYDLDIGARILRTGSWEPHVSACLRRVLQPGMTFVDVGANIGFLTALAAVAVGEKGHVIAVEPDPGNAGLLRLSVAVNPVLATVEVVEAGLADRDGALVLSDLGNPGNSGARFTAFDRADLAPLVRGPEVAWSSVPALCWDRHFGGHRVDVVKIDVEGFEPVALAGMEQTLRRDRPLLITELAPSNLRQVGRSSAEAYLGWLQELGYRWWLITEPDGELTESDVRSILDRARTCHHVDLLLAPARGSG